MMYHHPPIQRQIELIAYIRTRGPMAISMPTEYVRLNNLHEPDPYSLTLLWIRTAIEAREIQIYRDGNGAILYGMPKLKTFDKPRGAPPIQGGLTWNAPPTTAQLAAQAAKLATLTEQPQPTKEPTS